MQVSVHFLHKIVKVYSRFCRDIGWQRVEEQVHHHSLAAPHVAKHVNPLGNITGDIQRWLVSSFAVEYGGKEGFLSGLEGFDGGMVYFGRLVVGEHVVEALEVLYYSCKGNSVRQPISMLDKMLTSLVLVVPQSATMDPIFILLHGAMIFKFFYISSELFHMHCQ
jgi:hypothetical protein